MPGLVAVVFVLAFFVGPTLTRLSVPQYFAAEGFFSFFGTIIFAGGASLPGINGSVDGPLWTLRYEALCYVGLAAAGAAGLLAPRRMLLVAAGLSWLPAGGRRTGTLSCCSRSISISAICCASWAIS